VAIEGLSIRPYFDHNANPRSARDIRSEGFDAVAAIELGHEQYGDEEHLRWAVDHRRTLFTYDKVDFSVIADTWIMRGEEHAGIISRTESKPSDVPDGAAISIWETLPPELEH
jgi:hypothetical protein